MKKILFVDDEPRILDGLKRMLRSKRNEWDMHFVDGGAAALEEMSASHFDVIVSDMRMPGIDGAHLLALVQEEHPSTVRIVLSGYTEFEAALRAVPVAHQFLTKPCKSATIVEVVDRACCLQALLKCDVLQKAVSGMETLPVLPRVYSAMTVALADPDVDIQDVVDVVEQDAGVCAKILQIANSGFFGLRMKVSSIKHAISYLGINMLKNVALTVEMFQEYEDCGPSMRRSIEADQAHAVLASRIAMNLTDDKRMAEDAFMGAMLHDVGKLILSVQLPVIYARISEVVEAENDFLHHVEESLIGVSHAELGGYLLGIWGLPYPIVEAVANHHHPSRVPHQAFDVLGAVHVADVLAHEQTDSNGMAGCTPLAQLDLDYLQALGVADEIPAWREMAAEEAQAGWSN